MTMKKILYMVCFLLTLASCSEKDDWNTPGTSPFGHHRMIRLTSIP